MTATPSQSPRWLSPAAVARRLDVHVSTVRRWIESGTLPATKTPGGHYRIDESKIAGLISILK